MSLAAIVAACSSSSPDRKPGDTPEAGDGSGGSTPSTGGAGGRSTGGTGGKSTGGTSGAGTGGASGGVAGAPDGGDAGDAGDASIGDGGAGGDASVLDGSPGDGGDFGTPTIVDTFGCFSASGDGKDLLASGAPATVVTNSPHSGPCGGSQWISDNANAYSPATPPTTIAFRRSFVVDPSLSDGLVTASIKADDAAEIVLNGQSIATCTPPSGNTGFCQQACRTTEFPGGVLVRDGVNNVEIRLVNLQSAAAGGGNFGWTAISYTLCIAPPPPP